VEQVKGNIMLPVFSLLLLTDNFSIIEDAYIVNFPSCLKYGRAWKNDQAVAKVVTAQELDAHTALSGIEGIPLLFGSFVVEKDDQEDHEHGTTLSTAANIGTPIYDLEMADNSVMCISLSLSLSLAQCLIFIVSL
jgi:hypothetical protein